MSCSVPRRTMNEGIELPPEEVIFGVSKAMQEVRCEVENAATADFPVLLDGQSGTGKEVMASLIHRQSARCGRSFVKVNCPAIPETLLESELFGYERGAFTGAFAVKPGRAEAADEGTLFLDEIAEIPPSIQAKLLQLLQDGRFCRIGGRQERQVEVRVLCATNHDLADDVHAGLFRRDLFYRINVMRIHLPSLAERREDIPTLVSYLVKKYSAKYGRTVKPVSKSDLQKLMARPWLGNIRELENVIKRYVIVGAELAFGSSVNNGGEKRNGNGKHALPKLVTPENCDGSLKTIVRQAVKEFERDIILRTLEANRWNRGLTARALGISYAALRYKLREAGVPPLRGSCTGKVHVAEEIPQARNNEGKEANS